MQIFSSVDTSLSACVGLLQFITSNQSISLSPHAAERCFHIQFFVFGGFKLNSNVNRYKIVIQIHAFVSLLCHGCAVWISVKRLCVKVEKLLVH